MGFFYFFRPIAAIFRLLCRAILQKVRYLCMRLLMLLMIFLCGDFLLSQQPASAPPTERIAMRTIVQFDEGSTVFRSILKAVKQRSLSNAAPIFLLTYADSSSWIEELELLRQDPKVLAVQFDYQVKSRGEPNDPSYVQQPNLARLGFPEVWAENTGGKTPDGEQIVIAILDAGFSVGHEDLQSQLWINSAEVPDNGIDDDNNGYIDDWHGWNFIDDAHFYRSSQHGTQVLGMLAAKGNNGVGVTGTGWDNQVMIFAIETVSDIVAAYSYIIEQRQKWQRSDGREGALVVATNASFGLEGRPCSELTVWGNMYDQLGQQGILTAASTANRRWNVDDFGDMPTTCPSEFLLGITNIDADDRLASSAAWGPVSIDLAAPGQGSFTTLPNDGYGNFSRTSAAAPYVTGAIALLYSAPCDRLQYLMRNDPPAAARLVRRSLLQSAKPNANLIDLIATAAQLDVAAAWQQLKEECSSGATNQLSITNIYPNPSGNGYFFLEFADLSLGPYRLDLYDAAGRLLRQYALEVGAALPSSNQIDVAGLPAGCYQLRLSNEREVAFARLIIR